MGLLEAGVYNAGLLPEALPSKDCIKGKSWSYSLMFGGESRQSEDMGRPHAFASSMHERQRSSAIYNVDSTCIGVVPGGLAGSQSARRCLMPLP